MYKRSGLNLVLAMFFIFLCGPGHAQGEQWAVLDFAGVSCHFPTPYTPINDPFAAGVIHNGNNVYIAVTALPDTSGVDLAETRGYKQVYSLTLTKVLARLRGRLRDTRDTLVGDTPANFSSVEVQVSDSIMTRYDLLQVARNDSLFAFSCQYPVNDELAGAMRDYFFSQIRDTDDADLAPPAWYAKQRLWIALGIFVVMVIAMAIVRRRMKRDT